MTNSLPTSKPRRWGGLLARRERWGLTWRGWLALILVIGLMVRFGMLHIHGFLAPTQRVDHARILVVEGWVSRHAIKAAIEEFKTGHYEQIITTGGPLYDADPADGSASSWAGVGAKLLVENGLPPGQVQAVPSLVGVRDRTYGSALALKHWLADRPAPLPAFNLLTDDVHARRSHWLFCQAFGPQVPVGIISVADPGYDPAHWWHYSEGVRMILDESIAYLYARLLFSPEKPASAKTPLACGRVFHKNGTIDWQPETNHG